MASALWCRGVVWKQAGEIEEVNNLLSMFTCNSKLGVANDGHSGSFNLLVSIRLKTPRTSIHPMQCPVHHVM